MHAALTILSHSENSPSSPEQTQLTRYRHSHGSSKPTCCCSAATAGTSPPPTAAMQRPPPAAVRPRAPGGSAEALHRPHPRPGPPTEGGHASAAARPPIFQIVFCREACGILRSLHLHASAFAAYPRVSRWRSAAPVFHDHLPSGCARYEGTWCLHGKKT